MACLVLNTVVKLNGIRTWMYMEVAAYLPMFLKNTFGFCEVEVLSVDEFRVRIQNSGARAHFEEAVDDEDECWEMAGNLSVTFRTLSTVCWTAFPTDFRVERHLLRNCWRPSSKFLPR